MTKYCHTCALYEKSHPDKECQEYQDWFVKHEPECNRNHEGPPGAMEKMAAEQIWCHSVDKHNLRYTTVLSDGDTKTVDYLNKDVKPYGDL